MVGCAELARHTQIIMSKRELELVGAILYKCEGTKLRRDKRYPNANTFCYQIDFTNSDPLLIKLWLEFLRKILKVKEEKIRVSLHLYDNLNRDKVITFWSILTKIPKTQFYNTKSYYADNPNYKPNPLGTCRIRYAVKKVYLKLNEIIKRKLGKEAALIK